MKVELLLEVAPNNEEEGYDGERISLFFESQILFFCEGGFHSLFWVPIPSVYVMYIYI